MRAGPNPIIVISSPVMQYGVPFCDADDLHPASNVAKMSRGDPLTDQVRSISQAACLSVVHLCIYSMHAGRIYLNSLNMISLVLRN